MRWRSLGWAVLAGVGAAACGGSGPAGPSSRLPRFSGNYLLELEGSSTCTTLPVRRFQWDVLATSSTAEGLLETVKVTLPGGQGPLIFDFAYSEALPPSGNLIVIDRCERDDDDLAIGVGGLHLALGGSLSGVVSRGADGRGQVVNGSYSGEIEVLRRGECSADDTAPICHAADHRWTLRAR